MAFVNLFPIGMSQLQDSLAKGYVHARSFDFRVEPWVNRLEWARLPGDALFILGGALPLLWICIQTIRHPNPKQSKPEETLPTQLFTNVERDH
jgi:nitric oxide reductase subunit B